MGIASEAELMAYLTGSQPQEVSKVVTTLIEESQEESVTTVYSVETIDLEAHKQELMQSVVEIGIVM